MALSGTDDDVPRAKTKLQPADILSTIDDCTVTEAHNVLTGKRGPVLAERAARAVRGIEDSAREWAVEHGAAYGAAVLQILEDRGTPHHPKFPRLNEKQTWSLLTGVQVHLTRRKGDLVQSVHGILLPWTPREPTPQLRVALTEPARGHAVGDVLLLHPRLWQSNPSPAGNDSATSSQGAPRTGLPFYSRDTLPFNVLATLADLNNRRLQPAHHQAPIASTRIGKRPEPLYAIADTIPIPPASPQSARRLKLRRTCAQCGLESAEPLDTALDQRRYCDAHHGMADQRVRYAIAARDQAACAIWARRRTADPATTLAVLYQHPDGQYLLRAETMAGVVLIDHTITDLDLPRTIERMHGGPFDIDLPAWIDDPTAHLAKDRRVLLTSTHLSRHFYSKLLETAGCPALVHRLHQQIGDDVWQRHEIWSGKDTLDDLGFRDRPIPRDRPSERALSKEQSPAALIKTMRSHLLTMAAAELTPAQTAFAEALDNDTSRAEYHHPLRRWNRLPSKVRYFTQLLAIFPDGTSTPTTNVSVSQPQRASRRLSPAP